MKILQFTIFLLFSNLLFAQHRGNSLLISFRNQVGNDSLFLNQGIYTNQKQEKFSVSRFDFFVSNLELEKLNGEKVYFPEKYFLIRQNLKDSWQISLNEIPKGNYRKISFIVGVDSLKSVANVDALKGDLDIGNAASEMYWSWNSGYIFLKLEGKSPESLNADKSFAYHIGGYGIPTVSNIKKVNLPFEKNLAISETNFTEIDISVDVLKIFENLSINRYSNLHTPNTVQAISAMIPTLFSIKSLKNVEKP